MKKSFTPFRAVCYAGSPHCFLLFFSLLLSVISIAQRQVTGKVTGMAGEAMAGVSIQVRGTAGGATTDTAGNYSISVPSDTSVLVFSFVGFSTQEVTVGAQTVVNISLSAAASELNTVVVVGYGTQRKRDLTGSISSVNGDEVARLPNTNPIASLQGKVAGLTVANSGVAGASPVVRIRGINSTNTANPVYVVDGILQDNIDYLNPADIESIDVLKDPSSIAIYGLRAANGVIAVTLKKAARGRTIVNLQTSVGVQRVQDRIKVVDAAGFRRLYDAQLRNLNAAPFDYTNYTGNTNWQDLVLRDAVINNNNLSISSSGEKTTTHLSIGYTHQDGVLRNNNFKRYLARFSQDVRITPNIRVGGDINGTHIINNPASVNVTNALWAAPIVPVQADENTYYAMPSFQRAQVGNPIAALNRSDRTAINKGYRLIGTLFAEIKFARSFTWKSTIYGDFSYNTSRDYSPLPFSFINLGEGAAQTTTTFDNTVRTSASQSQSESRRFQQDHTLSFDKRVGNGHSFNAVAGFTTLYNNSSFINGTRRDTSVNIPNNPDYWYINIVNQNNPGNFGGGGGESALAGAFGRVSYNYKGRYLLNATIRTDGSSKFAPGRRWDQSGSIGLGWVVSDEDFFSDVKGFDFLKLRGAWGLTNNSNGIPDNLYRPGINNASSAKGIELSLGWNDAFNRDFNYGVSVNFSHNKNIVNAIGDNLNFQIVRGPNLTQTGRSIGYFYGYRQIGVYQSTADLNKQPAFSNSLPGDIAYEDVNGDGVISAADRTYLGTPFPPYTFGGTINLSYKGFDFMLEGQGNAGNMIYTQRRTSNFAVLNYETNRLDAWTGPGTSNVEPILDNTRGNNFLFSSYFLEPGDYFRIRNLQIGYNFSNALLSNIGITKARIYLNGQNIKSWSQVTGYSPEPLIGSILQGGADNGAYPVPATYSVGLNVTF
ncbi:MAG: SusC/RagA family TonB-linked outer membrane protein [Chitinophagaceae bacterium]|nr:MAG: SusC/RagA family TonB-linked outer membrane protein [Chitinophagaceae bacterium]